MQYQTAKMATNPAHADMKPAIPSPEAGTPSEPAESSGENTNSTNSLTQTPTELLTNGQNEHVVNQVEDDER